MADGIKDIGDIRSEPLTFRDGILRIDNMMPWFIKEAAMSAPATREGAYEGVYNLLQWKDSLIRIRASPKYLDEINKRRFGDMGIGAFASVSKVYQNYRLLMEWNRLMCKQYSKLGIIEPERYTDVWGDKDQIVDTMHKLAKTMTYDEFQYVVKSILEEGSLIEDSLPEGAENG